MQGFPEMGILCAIGGHIWTKVGPRSWVCFECGKKIVA